jgi:hypothetical protein
MSSQFGIDLKCYESIVDFDEPPVQRSPLKREGEDLDILVQAIELTRKKPLVTAEPISPEKAPLRLAVLPSTERPLSQLVSLRAFAVKAQHLYSQLCERDVALMKRAKDEGQLGKRESYEQRSLRYFENEHNAKRIQRDSDSILQRQLAFTSKFHKSDIN